MVSLNVDTALLATVQAPRMVTVPVFLDVDRGLARSMLRRLGSKSLSALRPDPSDIAVLPKDVVAGRSRGPTLCFIHPNEDRQDSSAEVSYAR